MGTSEGVRKAWEKRRAGGGALSKAVDAASPGSRKRLLRKKAAVAVKTLRRYNPGTPNALTRNTVKIRMGAYLNSISPPTSTYDPIDKRHFKAGNRYAAAVREGAMKIGGKTFAKGLWASQGDNMQSRPIIVNGKIVGWVECALSLGASLNYELACGTSEGVRKAWEKRRANKGSPGQRMKVACAMQEHRKEFSAAPGA